MSPPTLQLGPPLGSVAVPMSSFEEGPLQCSPSEQARFEVLWDQEMEQPTRPVKHDKAAVLLISWDKDCSDLETEAEVLVFPLVH